MIWGTGILLTTKRDTNSHTTRWNVLNGPRSYMLGKPMGRKMKEGRVLTEKERGEVRDFLRLDAR